MALVHGLGGNQMRYFAQHFNQLFQKFFSWQFLISFTVILTALLMLSSSFTPQGRIYQHHQKTIQAEKTKKQHQIQATKKELPELQQKVASLTQQKNQLKHSVDNEPLASTAETEKAHDINNQCQIIEKQIQNLDDSVPGIKKVQLDFKDTEDWTRDHQ